MAKRTNLRSENVNAKRRQTRKYGTQTPLSSTAVERGSTRWLDGSTVVIEGLLQVTGTLNADGTVSLTGAVNITGPLTIAGVTNITGPTTVTGKFDVNGPTVVAGNFDVNGPTKLNGATRITGKTTLENDLTVTDGGEVKVGTNMRLAPSVGGGSAVFPNGSMEGTPIGAQLVNSFRTTFVYVSDTQAGMAAGANAVLVTGGGTYLQNLPTTTQKPNLYIDPATSRVYRSTVA